MIVQDTDDTPYERRLFLARERMHRQVKTRANKKNKNRIHKEYEIGEKILLKSLTVSSSENEQVLKFFDVHEGPFLIKKKIAEDTYIIISDDGNEKGQFHMKNLKPYFVKILIRIKM